MIRFQRSHPERGGAWQVILAIIGGLVVLCLLAVVIAVWAVKNLVKVEVERAGDAKRVEIHTPIGDLEIRKAEDVASELHLPVYPGAVPDEEGASIRLRGRLWKEEGGLDVVAAKFRSDDPFDQVDAWYRERLGSEFVRQQGKIDIRGEPGEEHGWQVRVEPDGDDVVYSREREGRLHGVSLSHEREQVKIGLFEIREARHQ